MATKLITGVRSLRFVTSPSLDRILVSTPSWIQGRATGVAHAAWW